MKDVASAVEFAVEVEKLSSVVVGGVELDSVSVEMREICLEAADFAESADFVAADWKEQRE